MARTGPPEEPTVRSLAEILREHGLESEHGTRPGKPLPRRRREGEGPATGRTDPVADTGRTGRVDDTGRTAGTGAGRPAGETGRGPRATETGRSARATDTGPTGRGVSVPGGAGRPGSSRPSVPSPARASGAAAASSTATTANSTTTTTSRKASTASSSPDVDGPADAVASGAPSTAEIPGLRPSRKPGVPGADGDDATSADGEADEPLTAGQSALAWARFVGELVVSVAVGVGLYHLFTVLWELLPYVAVVAAPLAVTALVAGVGAWRARTGREPVGLPLLVALLFAGTLLTVVPAAALLGGT